MLRLKILFSNSIGTRWDPISFGKWKGILRIRMQEMNYNEIQHRRREMAEHEETEFRIDYCLVKSLSNSISSVPLGHLGPLHWQICSRRLRYSAKSFRCTSWTWLRTRCSQTRRLGNNRPWESSWSQHFSSHVDVEHMGCKWCKIV